MTQGDSFTTLVGGAGNDTITSGSDPTGSVDTLDFSAFGDGVAINLGSTETQAIDGLNITLDDANENGNEINAFIGGIGNDAVTGNGAGDTFYVGSGGNSFTGSGNDTYIFSGSQTGSDTINEKGVGGSTLNFYGLDNSINALNLNTTSTQALDSGFSLTLTNPAAFGTVVGTPYTDTIVGSTTGSVDETIIGGGGSDSLTAGSGNVLNSRGIP